MARDTVYRLGSTGEEVRRIQERLAEGGLYAGRIDGVFGGGTEAAVRAWQQRTGLRVDGVVGPVTWGSLFDDRDLPDLASQSLDRRTAALTGTFETGRGFPECFSGLSGDFDGQGISFGALQWNFGQGSLQPLLGELLRDHREVMESTFGNHLGTLEAALAGDREELMAFSRAIQHPRRHVVFEPWRGMFRALGRTEPCQAGQVRAAGGMYRTAVEWVRDFGLRSERAVALMFDIRVQNGSISRTVRARIEAEVADLPGDLEPERREVESLRIVANRRAEASNPRWVEDVRRRKLTIAEGRGVVHGIHFDLERQFGIGLGPSADLAGGGGAG